MRFLPNSCIRYVDKQQERVDNMYFAPNIHPYYYVRQPMYGHFPYYETPAYPSRQQVSRRDFGGQPYVVNIEAAADRNRTFRTAIWTGHHLQVTLMSINPGDDIGLEIHPNTDQFIRIEEGNGIVQMGRSRRNLNFERRVSDDYAIMIPAGMWHNIKNTGNKPLKLYSIYAPPEHPFGTIHRTKRDAIAAGH